jgi:hypothetical protein
VPGARGEDGPRRNLSRIITFITFLERRIVVQVNNMIMVVCGAFVVKRARAQNSHRVTDQKRSKGLTSTNRSALARTVHSTVWARSRGPENGPRSLVKLLDRNLYK